MIHDNLPWLVKLTFRTIDGKLSTAELIVNGTDVGAVLADLLRRMEDVERWRADVEEENARLKESNLHLAAMLSLKADNTTLASESIRINNLEVANRSLSAQQQLFRQQITDIQRNTSLWVSSEYVPAPALLISENHNLGCFPVVQAWIRCVVAHQSWKVGDRTQVGIGNFDAGQQCCNIGMAVVTNISTLTVRLGAGPRETSVINIADGGAGEIVNANWRLYFLAHC